MPMSIDRLPASLVGAQVAAPSPVAVNVTSIAGIAARSDLRVRLEVPSSYVAKGTTSILTRGIIFPYTPTISYEHKADYATTQPVHSNFAMYFYKNSSVSSLQIAGKFTVQNDADAKIYLATVHLLRALTKMRFGEDVDSGSPPPVCRLYAYGEFMLDKVPVAISSFKNDLTPDTEYYYLKDDGTYKSAMVPAVSTISITCMPMYSRTEMKRFNVDSWLGSSSLRKAGYL